MAVSHYHFRLQEEERGSQTYKYVHIPMESVDDAADSLHKTLFEFYYLTEARYLGLLLGCMELIKWWREESGKQFLDEIGYPESGDLNTVKEGSVTRDFFKDFNENLSFRKIGYNVAEYSFKDLHGYISNLYKKASTHYDSERAALFRSSASLGILLRLVGDVAKRTENRQLDGNMIDLFRNWKLTSKRNLPYESIMRPNPIDFLKPREFDQQDFFEIAKNFRREVRMMLMLSGAKRGTFEMFIEDQEKTHLNGNEIVNVSRFDGGKLVTLMSEWLRTHPMRYPVHEFFDSELGAFNARELKNSMTDSRIPEVNIDILYNDMRHVHDYHGVAEEEESPYKYRRTAGEGGSPIGETDGYEDPYAPTPGDAKPASAPAKKEQSSSILPILAICAGGVAIYYS